MCVTFLSLVKCVCVAFVAIAGRRYTYTVCTYLLITTRVLLVLVLALGAVEMSLRRLGGKVARDEDDVGRVDKLLVELPQRWREAPEQA